jgi:adenosylcobalamin-dependent ribonucleoside-triphosphate reductase
VTENVLTNGEPGYWNSELTNEGEVYEIVATNPCGEIGLPEYGACCLGHVNMDYFAPTKNRKTDYLGLIEAHRLMTRFLVRATFGDMNDAEQDEVMSSERRIGVGHFGVQGFFAKRGVRYSDVPKQRESKVLLKELYDEVRKEARTYAFALRIPEPVKVTTVAPTGTIAKLPGATEGIHPIYARHFLRRVRFSMADPDQRQTVQNADLDGFATEVCQYDPSGNTMIVVYPTKDNLVQEVEDMGLDANELVQSADEISLVDMLSFQALYQTYWADNAVSYTVNVPAEPHQNEAMARGEDVPPPTSERLATVAGNLAGALRALKGTTIMLDGSRPQAPYERISAADYALYQAVQVSDGIDENCATGACPVR